MSLLALPQTKELRHMIEAELTLQNPAMAAWPAQHLATQLRAVLDAYKEVSESLRRQF